MEKTKRLPITLSESELLERAKLCAMYHQNGNIKILSSYKYHHSEIGESIVVEFAREGITERKGYCISLEACQYGYIGKYEKNPIDKRTLVFK